MTFEEWYDSKPREPFGDWDRELAKEAWNEGVGEGRKESLAHIHFGHDEPCAFCGERCDGFAGNPSLWPLIFTHPDGTGRPKAHHVGCVQKRLFNL